MKAIIRERFGVEGLEFRDAELPEIADDEVLVRVRASSVNPMEFYEVYGPPFIRIMNGQPRRPKDPRIGADFAGVVDRVGAGVGGFAAGDEVFGTAVGSWAEYAVASPARIAHKPSTISFEDAAAMPVAAITALQAVRDVGQVRAGMKVLVNGCAGGVGTYAIQLAKWADAEVTGVCSTRNVEQSRSLGADRVIDYLQEDFTEGDDRYDVMLDVAGSRSFLRCRRVLQAEATVVVVGAKMSDSFLGPLKHIAGSKLQSIGRSQRARFFVARIGTEDLEVLGKLMVDGRLRSVIDQTFTLGEAADAVRYLAGGHARGKVVLTAG